jgi:hypothetical protein
MDDWDNSDKADVRIAAISASVSALDVALTSENTTWSWASGHATDTTTQEIADAAGASKYNYLKKIFIVNNDDANLELRIQENGSPTDVILGTFILPAFGGQLEIDFPGKGMKQLSANTAIDVTHIAGATPEYTWFVQYVTGT